MTEMVNNIPGFLQVCDEFVDQSIFKEMDRRKLLLILFSALMNKDIRIQVQSLIRLPAHFAGQ